MKMFLFLLIFIATFSINVIHSEEIQPTVTTPLGPIEGHIGYTINGNPFYKFEGVPYAKPPVGSLRFEEPQDPEPWSGIWKAKTLTACIQHDHFNRDYENKYITHGDEDCLYVNIYTRSISKSANLDVLLHIHGGAFMFGSGANYGPDIIMDRNIVFVSFNYRLGPLGFLSTEDKVLPGNIGLKDQIKALKWVNKNIQYFGGNPKSITLHGMSAGGASVHFHYFSPQSKGLFKGGISQSGSMLNPWVLNENVKQKTEKIAHLVGCATENSQAIVDCLKTKPARQIVEAVAAFQPFLYNPFSPFGAVIDGHWSKNPVLPDHPYILLKENKLNDAPWIISYTSAEGLYPAAEFYSNEQNLLEIETKWNDIMPFILHYNESVNPELKNAVSEKIRKYYFGEKRVNRENYHILVELVSDRLFVEGIEKSARLQSIATKSKVYSYLMNYSSSTSFSEITGNVKNVGVSHGDDTMLLLSVKPLAPIKTDADRKVSKLLLDLTESFMKNGEPNIGKTWTPVSKNANDRYKLLKINSFDNIEELSEKFVGNSDFWDSLPLKENEKLLQRKDEL